MPAERKTQYTTKQLVHLFISLMFMFVLGRILPTWSSVTRLGVEAICIFIGTVWMISNRFGMIIPSALLMFAMLCTGYISGTDIISSTLGSATVWQLLIIFVLLKCVTNTGADGVLARWMISRKALNGKPVLFCCVFMVAVTILGSVASALGAFLFATAMVNSISDECGYEMNSHFRKSMTCGVLIASSVGGGILPFKGMAAMILSLLQKGIEEAGLSVDLVSYMIAAFLSGLFISLVFALCLKPLFHVDFSKMTNIDIAEITSRGGTKFNKRQAWSLIIFLIGIAYSIVLIWLPKTAPGYITFNNIGQGCWFMFMVILVGLIHIDGEPLLNVEREMAPSINWGIIMAVCAFTAIGGMISNADLGIRPWLTEIMNVVFGSMPFPVFVLVLVTVTLLCTNVFSNTATAIIIGTIVGPYLINYALTIGINPSCIVPAIVMTALCAFLTPAAGGSAPLFLASDCMKDDQKWVFTYGLLIFPIVIISSSIAYIACAYLL